MSPRRYGDPSDEAEGIAFEQERDDYLADRLDDWVDCRVCGRRRDIGDVDARGVCHWCGGSA